MSDEDEKYKEFVQAHHEEYKGLPPAFCEALEKARTQSIVEFARRIAELSAMGTFDLALEGITFLFEKDNPLWEKAYALAYEKLGQYAPGHRPCVEVTLRARPGKRTGAWLLSGFNAETYIDQRDVIAAFEDYEPDDAAKEE